MFDPSRFHWYPKVTPSSHVPGTAVSVLPKTALPEMVGVGVSVSGPAVGVTAVVVTGVSQ